MSRSCSSLCLLLLAFFHMKLAQASLYPTSPIADTIVNPGQRMNITWVDTQHHRPHLAEMGSLRIVLCDTDGTPVKTLAKGVSPLSRIQSVEIPQNLSLPWIGDQECHKFAIQFISAYPVLTIWTADFCIVPLLIDTVLPYSQLDNDTTATDPPPMLTLVLPTTTIVVELEPVTKVPAVATITAGPLPPGEDAGGTGLNRVHVPNAAANPRHKLASEYHFVKFRLAFIAWPALFGLSMAL
ncbi:hypothetical protein R3P38DRAFT_2858533 [Favolaschia claudopus]|uniref:Uncharacterized protein n=1 Tax=Favolaschia claudopus TaxID=2862362 RepID=A0AAW0DK03_9AGAR